MHKIVYLLCALILYSSYAVADEGKDESQPEDASFFVGESGRTAARLEIACKHRFSPRLSLTPDLEANFLR